MPKTWPRAASRAQNIRTACTWPACSQPATRSSTGVVKTVAELRARLREWRARGQSLGLVPTMGALHEGHLSLVRASLAGNDRTVVSVFVNPLQFVAGEDFESYPRDLDADLKQLGELGVDAIFAPDDDEVYPPGATTLVKPPRVAAPLEGERRPGHFEGVVTVVAKLFNIVQPDRAYFGQKDAQQLAVIRALQRDLVIPVDVVGCPIVRAQDGLALSSRNAYLNAEERRAATILYRSLQAARAARERGEDALRALRTTLAQEPLAKIDYAEIVDPESFEPPGDLAVLAVRIGRARLIDNHLLSEELST